MPDDKTYYTQSDGFHFFGRILNGLVRLVCWVLRTQHQIKTGEDPLRDQIDRAKRVILQHLAVGGVQEKIDTYLFEHERVGKMAILDAWQELVNEGKIQHNDSTGRWEIKPEE